MICVSGICQYFAEVCLYLSTLRFIFTFFAEIQAPGPVAGIFFAAGIASAFFSRFKGFKAYLPLLLTLPAFSIAGNTASVITLIPLEMLLFAHIMKKGWKGDSVLIRGMMGSGALLFAFILLAASLGEHFSEFRDQAIPFFTSFLGIAVLALRIARNEDAGKTDAKFYLLNIGLVCLVGGAGFFFSSRWLLGAVKAVTGAVYKYVIAPLLMLFAYGAMAVSIAVGWLLRNIKMEETEPFKEEVQTLMGDDDILKALAEKTEASAEWIGTLFTIICILVFLFICYVIIRKIADNSGQRGLSDVTMVRSAAEDPLPQKKRRRVFRSAPADAVRACYRKYLDICGDMTIPVDGSIASDEIAARSRHSTGEGPTGALRQLWLPARYSESASTEEDAKQAKQYLKEIKKNIKKE